ncbi:MAG: cohesin domain-containing protein [Dehalococcoidia bacterium]
MKKKSRWLVAVGLVLALTLVLVPTQVMAEPDGAVDPNGPYYPPAGGTFTVDVNIDNVAFLSSLQFKMSYDDTVIDWVSVSAGPGVWFNPMMVMATTFDDPGQIGVSMMDLSGMGGNGGGTLVQLTFDVVGASCDVSALDMSSHVAFNGLYNTAGGEIPSTWGDGSVEVDGPCGPPLQHIVVSGKLLPVGAAKPVDQCPPLLPYDMWGDTGNDWGEWNPPGPPPGFEECDEFHPCEWVWVWGYDFEYCQTYRIWIQPYGPSDLYPAGPSVVEGQELLEGLCPPRFPPVDVNDPPDPCPPPGWMPGWVDVHIDEDGKFGPVPIWHVDGEYCELWEIVADKIDIDATNPGFYGSNEDGLDAACIGEWGFHIYPEGLTIILLSLGLVAVGGYLVVRRRKGAETDS